VKQKRTKKKEKKNVPVGKAFIQATYNNTIITLTDMQGNVLSWASSGGEGFRGFEEIHSLRGPDGGESRGPEGDRHRGAEDNRSAGKGPRNRPGSGDSLAFAVRPEHQQDQGRYAYSAQRLQAPEEKKSIT